jgi:hypothetical protein
VGWEVAGGDLEGVEDEAGAAVVDGLGGEADGDLDEGFLDGVAGVREGEFEFVAGDDVACGVGAVVVAEVFVVHGVGAAAAARFRPEHALVWNEWISFSSVVALHVVPPGVYTLVMLLKRLWLQVGIYRLV